MSHRPFYQLGEAAPSWTGGSGNAGLWWSKFFDGWTADLTALRPPPRSSEGGGDPGGKAAWVLAFDGKAAGEAALLDEHLGRRDEMVDALGGRRETYALAGRLVTGLGLEHPIENGFAWHHLLGVPYIPGSGIKGALRAWARETADEDAAAEIDRLFGTASDGGGVGAIAVLDGLPTAPVPLAAEVMTPHIGDWLSTERPEASPPGDWIDPVPIPFLAVEAGASFAFALLPTARARDGDLDLDLAMTWLGEALGLAGVGAKTATGFGQFATGAAAAAWLDLPEMRIEAAPVVAPPPAGPGSVAAGLAEQGSGFARGDRVVHVSDPDAAGTIVDFEGSKPVVDFGDGDQGVYPPDELSPAD